MSDIHRYITTNARCPECGAVIGGSHVDLQGNWDHFNRVLAAGNFMVTCDNCGKEAMGYEWLPTLKP